MERWCNSAKKLDQKEIVHPPKVKSSPLKSSALYKELKRRNEIIQNQVRICRRNYLAKILETYPFS